MGHLSTTRQPPDASQILFHVEWPCIAVRLTPWIGRKVIPANPLNTLLIGYDLNRPEQNYATLIDRLNAYPTHWHCLDSTWIVKSNESALEAATALGKLIDANDEILVVNISGDSAAWNGFNQKCSDWLKTTL